MRSIGNLDSEADAQLFVDYLLVLGIESEFDDDEGVFPIWVHADRDLEASKRELESFRSSTDRSAFARSAKEAESLRRKEAKEEQEAAKKMKTGSDVFRSFNRMGLSLNLRSVTFGLIVVSVLVTIVSGFGSADFIERFLIWDLRVQLGRLNEWWRPITANFVHFGPVHLLMDMYWLAYLGSMFERRRSWWALLLVVLVCGGAGLLLEIWIMDTIFNKPVAPAGMSGGIFALFGYMFTMMHRSPGSRFEVNERLAMWMIAWIPIGFLVTHLELMPIANWAHIGGLFAGTAYGFVEAEIRKRT